MIDKYAQAHNRIRKLARMMRKRAETVSDAAGMIVGNSLAAPFAGSLPGLAGTITGMAMPTPTVADVKQMDAHPGLGFIPAVGSSRMVRRSRAIRNLLKDKDTAYSIPWSDYIGTNTSILLPGIIGAGLGGIYGGTGGRPGAGIGAAIGGLTGMGLGIAGGVGGALGAAMTRRRTMEEQAKSENEDSTLAKALIPGVASYSMWKRLGASKHLSEMSEDDINKEVKRIKKLRGVA